MLLTFVNDSLHALAIPTLPYQWVVEMRNGKTIHAKVVAICTSVMRVPIIPTIARSDEFAGGM